jgi:hypothetical protein
MSIEDRLAIQDMIAQYSYAYDSQDAEAFAQPFVDDGLFEISSPAARDPSSASVRERRFANGALDGCASGVGSFAAVTTNPVFCSTS